MLPSHIVDSMKFEPAFLNDLKQRLRASDVIGQHVRLKHKAGGEFSGLCPFHNEKTPSFTVSDTKGFYHCFGCGAHGDPIRFTMEIQHLTYGDAVKYLAEQIGLPIPEPRRYHATKESYEVSSLYEVMESATSYYQQQLQQSMAEPARRYLQQRYLQQDTIDIFRIGYAPSNHEGLITHLKQQFPSIKESDLLTSGLILKNERGLYGRFRNRIMFPISDSGGKIIAFGARALGDAQPKYLNSPETPIFKKGTVLYYGAKMQSAAYKENQMIVTEGYMDVIALYQAGIRQVAAPLGTALTLDQMQYLWKLCPTPVLCLDGDNAGQRAMERAMEVALPALKPGYSLKFAYLPKGKDPDDVINQQGLQAILRILEQATVLSEAIWQRHLHQQEIDTPEGKSLLEKTLDDQANRIVHANVRFHFQSYFRKKMKEILYQHSGKYIPKQTSIQDKNQLFLDQGAVQQEYALIRTILEQPDLLEDAEIQEEFFHMHFHHESCQQLQQQVIELIGDRNEEELGFSKKKLHAILEKKGMKPYIQTIKDSHSMQLYQHISDEDVKEWWKKLLKFYNLSLLKAEHEEAVQLLAKDLNDNSFRRVTEIRHNMEQIKQQLEIQD